MRNIFVSLFFFALCSLFFVQPVSAKADKQTVVLSCDLHCQGCCDKIMKNIAFEKGVKDLVCDLQGKTVTVTYDAKKTDVETLLKAFAKIGKPAKVVNNAEANTKANAAKQTDAETGASMPQ